MKKKFLYSILFLSAVSMMQSCKKEDDNLDRQIVGLGGDTYPKTALDTWLFDNFTKPYNIDVKYRWDGAELAIDRTLVPPSVDKVQPIMETVKAAWIDVYAAEAGEVFVKKLAPKQYVLVGSLQYNSGNTVTLGEAEGGNKVTLFNVNNFDKTNRNVVKPVLKTIHHEFAHILAQNITYPKDFPLVTPAGYTADWNNTTLASARAAGFITQYSQAAPGEDFAEMVSVMLTEGKAGFDAIIKSNTTATAVTALRKKEEIVVGYFKQAWGIDFYALQNRTTVAINNLTSPLQLSSYLGFGKTYTAVAVNPATTSGMSADFITAYNAAKTNLANLSATAKYSLDNFSIVHTTATDAVLRVTFTATGGTQAGTSFQANITYKLVTAPDGTITFTAPTLDANAGVIAASIAPLTNYLTTGSFRYTFYYSPDFKYEYGGFTKVSNPGSFFFGTLG
ncbi:MAG: hypothetical protein K0S09_1178 [Sphingobacteriaceae bacterium]|jgi:substrate import-associated zinc metallohydrolase lipoprotein|nr:hypothetical protein [Sphingobacteriaceae bacterium]